MFQSYSSRGFILLTIALLVVNALFFYFVTDMNNLAVEMGEEGLLENLQLVYLGLGAFAFLFGGMRLQGPARMFAIGMCLLMLIFFLRELEIAPTDAVSDYLNTAAFRWHETFVVVGIAAIYIFRRSEYVLPVLRFVFSLKAWPFYLAAALVLLGEVFEKMHGFAYNEFIEEVLESLSYFLLLCLGVQSILSARKKPAV
ncbi:hypothetical protein G3A39_43095 [Paraburkholderia aspalathi]|nr:hypothetical protein [Paraburkholderia aspalathi]